MMNHNWRDIPGYKGRYAVSRYGSIYSYHSTKILKNQKNKKDGYACTSLYNKGKCKKFQVHCLVWAAFNGAIPKGRDIHHSDTNRMNARLDNLSCLTHQENCLLTTGSKNKLTKVKALRVIKLLKEGMLPKTQIATHVQVSYQYVYVLKLFMDLGLVKDEEDS